jgi:hypothetical protein
MHYAVYAKAVCIPAHMRFWRGGRVGEAKEIDDFESGEDQIYFKGFKKHKKDETGEDEMYFDAFD